MRTLLASLLLIGISCATADTWVPPTTKVVHSRDGNIVVRIDPVAERGNEKARPLATITKWDSKAKSYQFVRRVTLRNPRSPVTALITNDARFLVSFDDWFGVGTTDNAVVIYDLHKGTVHNHRLEDFLPESYRERLSRSTSSITWREDPFVIEWDQTIYVPLPDTHPDKKGFEPHIVIDPAKNRIWLQKENKSER